MREPRLGDIIDDFCVKCKRIMNHAVVSLLNGEPAKVRCRTCHNDHDYRHEQPPPPKVDTRKQALFNEVLAKVAPGSTAGPVATEPFLDDPAEEIVLEEIAPDEIVLEEESAKEALAEEVQPEEAPVQKAKATAKPKAKLTKPKAIPKTAAKATAKTSAKAGAQGRK
jgi:hypothetical protein